MSIDVVIVNWNSGAALQNCIASVTSAIQKNEIQICVVDNNSSDNSLVLNGNESLVEIVYNKENLGFGKACNIGAKKGTGDWLLFLNPDTKFSADIFSHEELKEKMLNEKIAVIGVGQKNEQGNMARTCCRKPTFTSMLAHNLGLDRVFPKLGYVMSEWDHMQSKSVNHVIGSFYLIRRSVFDALQGFDENFFVYLEDLDLSIRVIELGFQIHYLAVPQIYHEGGGCSKNIPMQRLVYDLQSREYYIRKHFSLTSALVLVFVQKFIEPIIRMILQIGRGNRSGLLQVARAYKKYLFGF